MLAQNNLPSLWLLPCTALQGPDVLPDVLSLPKSPQIQQLAGCWAAGEGSSSAFLTQIISSLAQIRNFKSELSHGLLLRGFWGVQLLEYSPPTSRSSEKIQILLAQHAERREIPNHES